MPAPRGVTARLRDQPRSDPTEPSSPPARRQRRRRWSDPRLWFGIVLVLGSVVIGAKVVGSVDDTVAVWQVAHDVPAGSAVGSSDLRVTAVHFDDTSAGSQYLPAGRPVPVGALAARDLHAGELLQPSALRDAGPSPVRQLPLGVGPAHAPADLRAGDHVDVWAVPPASDTGEGAARGSQPVVALHDVVVMAVSSDSASVSQQRQILVGIGPSVDVGSVLRQTSDAELVLVRLAG